MGSLKYNSYQFLHQNFCMAQLVLCQRCHSVRYQFLIMDHYVKKTNLGCLYHSHAVASGPWATDPSVWGCNSGGPPAIRSLPCFCNQIYLAAENNDRSTRRRWAYCPTDHWPAGQFAVGCCSTPSYHCLKFWCRAGSNCQKEVGQSSWPFTFLPLHFSNFQLCLDYTLPICPVTFSPLHDYIPFQFLNMLYIWWPIQRYTRCCFNENLWDLKQNCTLSLFNCHFVQLILFTSVHMLWNCYEGLNPEGMQHLIGAGR